MKKIFYIVMLAMFLTTNSAFSQEDWFSIPEDEPVEHSGIHSHHIGLFLGAASNLKNGHIGFASGVDYTYFFEESDPLVGVGGLFEGSFGKETEFILGPTFTLQPWNEVKFFVAPSVLFLNLETTEIDEMHETGETKFLLRFGTAYIFHFDRYSISPTLSADIVGSHVNMVYGLTFGIGF